MSVNNTTYKFCVESLRYIHTILGYDTIIKELNFIQHLHNSSIPEIVQPKKQEEKVEIKEEVKQEDDVKETTKNIVIETKHSRIEHLDEHRCEFILSTGTRCSFKKTHNSTCSRHASK